MDFKNSVGFLIHEVAQQLTSEADRVLFEAFGIGFAQYKILMCVESSPGILQKDIAIALNQSQASISRQVGLLIDADFIEIGEASDNRQHALFLTKRTENIMIRANSLLNTKMAENFSEFDERQIVLFHTMLTKLRRLNI